MEKRTLGKTKIKVSPIAFGAWAIGGWMWGGADESDAINAILASYNAGITTIDTAPVYGFGKSETLVAKAMKNVSRDKYQILTKFGMNWETNDGEFHFETIDNEGNAVKIYKWASKSKVIKECEASLKRLNTDYIDLYQIHWPDNSTPIHETFEAVQTLIKEGKVLAAGVCNYSTEQVDEALKYVNLASNQVPYSFINRNIEKNILPQALHCGISIIPYSPLQRGLLTGKIKPGHQFNAGDTRKGSKFYSDQNILTVNELLNEIKSIADKYSATLAQVLINWTMQQDGIATVLVGARNEKQVKENVKALEIKLTNEDLSIMNEVSNRYMNSGILQ